MAELLGPAVHECLEAALPVPPTAVPILLGVSPPDRPHRFDGLDRQILREVADLWKRIKRDPKWDTFREVLHGEPKLKKGKLIIFTESRETAE